MYCAMQTCMFLPLIRNWKGIENDWCMFWKRSVLNRIFKGTPVRYEMLSGTCCNKIADYIYDIMGRLFGEKNNKLKTFDLQKN